MMREWTFFVVGVVLTLVGIWLTLHLRPGRRLNVHIATVHLTDKEMSPDPEVLLSFQGKSVNGIARHVIYAWNSGNVSIRSEDISKDVLLGVRFSEKSMLSIHSSIKVGQTFSIDTTLQDNFVHMKFSHLDIGQGFVFWLKEGIESYDSYAEPTVEGHVLDSKGIVSGVAPYSASYWARNFGTSAGIILGLIVGFFIVLVVLEVIYGSSVGTAIREVPTKFGVFMLGVVFSLVGVQGRYLSRWVRALRYRVPKFSNLETK